MMILYSSWACKTHEPSGNIGDEGDQLPSLSTNMTLATDSSVQSSLNGAQQPLVR